MKETQYYKLDITIKGNSLATTRRTLRELAEYLKSASDGESGSGIFDDRNYFYRWEVK